MAGLVIGALFLLAAYGADRLEPVLLNTFGVGGLLGMVAYVFISIVATVLLPVSMMPLIPLAVELWGFALTAVLSIVGWTLGSLFAFLIARHFGQPLFAKLVDLPRAARIARAALGKNQFAAIVVLHVILPVDILSYALGLFTDVRISTYAGATLVGITPFAFYFAYAATKPAWFQILALGLTGILVIGALIRIEREALQEG